MTQEELNKILEDHKLWIKTGGEKGARADFKGANLIRINLAGANLAKADLSETNLSWANLSLANFEGANLERASLFEANILLANLERANLFKASLHEANLSEANLRKANFEGANLSRANLSEANLFQANFSEADLSDAFLFTANLSQANFEGANLEGAKGLPEGLNQMTDNFWVESEEKNNNLINLCESSIDTLKKILQSRQEKYGDSKECLSLIAEYWSTLTNKEITPKDVCVMMASMKLARLKKTQDQGYDKDTLYDLAGYALLALEQE